ncbi:MAG: polysulfide reductase NrfD [Chloroflexi bacterium]|nr:polysulfide reductase NrfD [Chloroflexota bacterium]
MTAESATIGADKPRRIPLEAGEIAAEKARALTMAKGAFVVGYNTQNEWAWLIATAFFLGKLGGGFFAVSLFVDSGIGMLFGILIVAIGKSAAHLLYLGRWERFWRAAMNPGSSWIARGLIAMGVFTIFGLIYVAPYFGVVLVAKGSAAWEAVRVIALASVFVVMIYDGFVMSASPSIPLWNTSVLPVLCLSYSLLGGASLSLALQAMTAKVMEASSLETMEIGLIVANIIIVGSYISTMFNSTSAGRQAAISLIRGKYAAHFLGGAVFVGLIVTLLLALFFVSTGITAILVLAVIADLIGHFTIFFLLLRAGLFAPVM